MARPELQKTAFYDPWPDPRIPRHVGLALQEQIQHLCAFKSELLIDPSTPTARAKKLLRVEKLAQDLTVAIGQLEYFDRAALDGEFFSEKGLPLYFDDPDLDVRFFDVGGYVAPAIGAASNRVIARLGKISRAGRMASAPRFADFIRCIAGVVKSANIKPAHSGLFAEICREVFNEAGVIFPDRALRYFMREIRPAMKSAGHCL